jgi:hypothetical protein
MLFIHLVENVYLMLCFKGYFLDYIYEAINLLHPSARDGAKVCIKI